MSLVIRCGMLSSCVAISLLGSAPAWAVSADALRCTFEVRDESDAVLSSTEVSPQVARVPVATTQVPGFRETAAGFSLSTTIEEVGHFDFDISYYHATDGSAGFQTGCTTQSFCSLPRSPGSFCGGVYCAIPGPGPDSDPYSGWRPVALFDGVPQLDNTGLSGSRTWKDGVKTYQTNLACRHLGTYP